MLIPRRSRVAFLAMLVMPVLAFESPAFRRPHGAARVWDSPRRMTPPPALKFDVNTGTGPASHPLADFVDQLAAAQLIDPPKPVPVYMANGNQCNLWVAPVHGSVDIPKSPDNTNAPFGYVAAVIYNFDDCHGRNIDFDKGKRAVWVVQWSQVSQNGVPMPIGTAQVIVLHKNSRGGDDYLSKKDGWTFEQCGDTQNPHRPDDATILTRQTVCPKTKRYQHNSDSLIAWAKLQAKRRGEKFTANDDPALWFACGGDCCFSDIR